MEEGGRGDVGRDALTKLAFESAGTPHVEDKLQEDRIKKKAAVKAPGKSTSRFDSNFSNEDDLNQLKQIHPGSEIPMEEEVRQAEMESRLRRMITEVLKPSIVKVTRLQTDHEVMCQKFQEMVDSHQEVLRAQKEAKEHSEVIGVFNSKLTEFWTFSNQLEDKITAYQKTAVQRMEELEQSCEQNKSSSLRLGRNLDRALQDVDRVNSNIKTMQVSLEKGIQKNKEHVDTEIRHMHIHVGEIRDLHNKLEVEVWGPEDCNDISPPCLRKLDMQMKKQTALLGEALEDITALQKLDAELVVATRRQGITEEEIKELRTLTDGLGERVEASAIEAKADFKQASNLMAAFSANLVREARHSFKDELKHAQQMQKDVDDFVKQTQAKVLESNEFVTSLSRQLEAMIREVRFDLDSYDQKRHRDKQSLEEQMRNLQSRVTGAVDSSDFILKGLEHVSGVISMSLQSQRMSVALDLQDFVERRDTPHVGVNASSVETMRLRQIRAERGIRQPGVDPEALHIITYQPQPISYQGASFGRSQLLGLREKLVHVAQEVLQQGPDMKRKLGPSPEHLESNLNHPMACSRLSPDQTRCSTPARPGSRGQPGARGSPLLEGRIEGAPSLHRELRDSPDPDRGPGVPQLEARWDDAFNAGPSMKGYEAAKSGAGADSSSADNIQLPALAAPLKHRGNERSLINMQAPLTAR